MSPNSDEIVKLRNTIEKMEEALKAARLLCANLEQGGQGHMTLVQNFYKYDGEVE